MSWGMLVWCANAAESWRFAAVRAHSLNRGDSWPFTNNFALKKLQAICAFPLWGSQPRKKNCHSGHYYYYSWLFANSWPFAKNFAHTYHPNLTHMLECWANAIDSWRFVTVRGHSLISDTGHNHLQYFITFTFYDIVLACYDLTVKTSHKSLPWEHNNY